MSDYLLGSSDREHARLIRQAARLAPITESLFREAGIGLGHRVLDIGSGVGDVAMLAASIVGPNGAVVGVERDAASLVKATARAAEAGLANITFVQGDVTNLSVSGSFDAAVGRYILQFLPDPAAVLRSVMRHVRPGGIIAFLEQSWAPFVLMSSHVPLWSAAVNAIFDVSRRGVIDMEMGVALHRAFPDAGLPIPRQRLVMELGHDAEFTSWVSDVVLTLEVQARQHGVSLEALGPLDTLAARLQTEVSASNTVVPWLALVAAWCRTPGA